MSPEQAAGEHGALDGRSDMYSLGMRALRDARGRAAVHRADARRRCWQTPERSGADGGATRGRPCRERWSERCRKGLARWRLTDLQRRRSSSGPSRFDCASRGPSRRPRGRASGPRRRRWLGWWLHWDWSWQPGSCSPAAGPARGKRQPDPTRLAVLPFENQGAPEDEYFADGMTDAVRGKLSALHALQITARQSSAEYKKSPKSLREIGQELGVRLPADGYRALGEAWWRKPSAGQPRVGSGVDRLHQMAAAVRRRDDQHLSRSRDRSRDKSPMRSTWRLERRKSGALADEADAQPRGLRRLSSGGGGRQIAGR